MSTSDTPEALGHFESIVLEREDAVTIVERLRETQVDVVRRAFILKLDTLIVRMGAKWDQKSWQVFEHLKTNFERQFEEPNWCIRISEDTWMALLPGISSRKGALAVAELWRDLCNFFVGDMSDIDVPIFEVNVKDIDSFGIRKIDLEHWYDAPEPDAETERPRVYGEEAPPEGPGNMGLTHVTPRPMIVAAVVQAAGRTLKVATSLEPMFEMRKMVLIGHRLEAVIVDAVDNTILDRKALSNLDWGLCEQVDLTNIEQGLSLLGLKTAEQRKMMMVVPAAFSTFASQKARSRLTQMVTKASADMGLKVVFEMRGLDGVPAHRVLDTVSLIKPFCMTVVGGVSADRKVITGLARCGLSGICLEYDGARREDDVLKEYLTSLAQASKAAAGACMVQGFENYRQMAVARLAGVTHASIKTAALMSPKGVVQTAVAAG